MKLDSFNEVAALKKPVYPEDGKEMITFEDPVLIEPQELDRFMLGPGKELKWINKFHPIKEQNYSAEPAVDEFGNKTEGIKMYKGQWRLANMKPEVEQAVTEKAGGT